jgi:hypothetical protein
MADVQVTCITKRHRQSSHEHITHLGNPAAGWKWSAELGSVGVVAAAPPCEGLEVDDVCHCPPPINGLPGNTPIA